MEALVRCKNYNKEAHFCTIKKHKFLFFTFNYKCDLWEFMNCEEKEEILNSPNKFKKRK